MQHAGRAGPVGPVGPQHERRAAGGQPERDARLDWIGLMHQVEALVGRQTVMDATQPSYVSDTLAGREVAASTRDLMQVEVGGRRLEEVDTAAGDVQPMPPRREAA